MQKLLEAEDNDVKYGGIESNIDMEIRGSIEQYSVKGKFREFIKSLF